MCGQRGQVTKFNLTFKGKVSPECDLVQVKTGLADILSIADEKMVDGFFSGDTVVLRSNLDRKTAAEYFVKFRELGAEVELVTAIDISSQSNTGIEPNPLIENHKRSSRPLMAEIRREQDGIIDQSWPVSESRTKSKPGNIGKLRKLSASHSPAKGPPVVNRPGRHKNTQQSSVQADVGQLVSSEIAAKTGLEKTGTNTRAQPNRQQKDNRARRKSQLMRVEKAAALELSRLENRIASIENKTRLETSRLLQAEDELHAGALQSRARLENDLLEAQEHAKRELLDLNELKAVAQHDCDRQKATLLQKQQEQDLLLKVELQRIQEAGQTSQEKLAHEIADLRQRQEQTRVSLSEDLAKLEKLMEATRVQASKDLTELETLASDGLVKLKDEESEFRRQESETKEIHQRDSATRDERKANAEQERDRELASLNRLQETAVQKSREGMSDLKRQMAATMSNKDREIKYLQELRNRARRQAKREQNHLYGLQKMVEQRKLAQIEKLKANPLTRGNRHSS